MLGRFSAAGKKSIMVFNSQNNQVLRCVFRFKGSQESSDKRDCLAAFYKAVQDDAINVLYIVKRHIVCNSVFGSSTFQMWLPKLYLVSKV